jgi:hypothetical protein
MVFDGKISCPFGSGITPDCEEFVIGFKAAIIWFLIACLAVVNGLLREQLLAPKLGMAVALPLSGLSLSVIVFAVTYWLFFLIRGGNASTYLLLGLQWVLMTLAFEFLFGHYVAGKSWATLRAGLNPLTGDLFSLVLVVSLLSPSVVARMKGEI